MTESMLMKLPTNCKQILLHLERSSEETTQSSLRRKFGWSKTQTYRYVDKLRSLNLVNEKVALGVNTQSKLIFLNVDLVAKSDIEEMIRNE